MIVQEAVNHFYSKWGSIFRTLLRSIASSLPPLQPARKDPGSIRGETDLHTRRGVDDSSVMLALPPDEAKSRAILDLLCALMFIQTRDGVYLDYYAKDLQALHVSPQEFLGKNMSEVLPPELATALSNCFARAAETGEIVVHEYCLDIQDQTRCFEMRIVPYENDKILSIVRDITERKLADMALSESQARLKLAMERARIGYWEFDPVSGQVTLSESMERLFGLAPGEFAGTAEAFYELVHPDDRDDLRAQAEYCLNTMESADAEYRIIRPDGEVRWIAGRGQALGRKRGEAARLLGMVFDITERKNAEEALRCALDEVGSLKAQLEAENVYLREEVSGTYRFGEITGESPKLLRVLKDAERVAPTDTTVLIFGETGTGKELLARAVHSRSSRSERPLVKVNCAALPASLIESELFGHERGAFTGAATKRVGRFELADGATIFLDEIGELPLELQAKLLRILQEGEFERLGSSKTIKVNVRVITATNRDLRQAIREGKFREDLYYRLNVYPLQLPPLRARKEDIPLLATMFLAEASRRLGRSFSGLPQKIIRALQKYDWPGNIRELQNVVERMAVTSKGRALSLPEDWGTYLSSGNLSRDAAEKKSPSRPARDESTLKNLEHGHILRILEQTHWRIEGPHGAAAILGIKPSTLRSRMQKLNIRRNLENFRSELLE